METAEIEGRMADNARMVAARVSKEMGPTIWEVMSRSAERKYPSEFARTILDAELQSPQVQAVYVYGNFGGLFMGRYKLATGELETYTGLERDEIVGPNGRLFVESILNGSMTIGSVKVVLSTDFLTETKARLFWVEASQALLLSLLCAAFLYFSINRVLLEPMRQVLELQASNEKQQELLHSIHRGTASGVGEDFLLTLVQSLCEALDVDCAYIGELPVDGPGTVRITTGHVRCGSALIDVYELPESLAERVIFGGPIVGKVADFEGHWRDPIAFGLGSNGVCSVPLCHARGDAIGLIMVLDNKVPVDRKGTLAVLEVFAARAGAELSRARASEAERLLSEQLQHSQRRETLGTLAGGIAHDFNNLLMPMGGYAELALDRAGPDDVLRDYLTQILEATRRAADVVNQIQSFSQAQIVSREKFSLQGLLEGMVRFTSGTLAASVSINLAVRPGLPLVHASRTQIDQCLVNLITNALHAVGSSGTISIIAEGFFVTAEYAAQRSGLRFGEHIKVSVSDDGCGMDEKTLARVFDPFFTTKAVDQGTGLGLATTHNIIGNHGGTIEVYSRLGVGSTFTILLPALADRKRPGEVERQVDQLSVVGLRVLFVDDEERNIKLARRMVEKLGCVCTTFSEPKVALAAYAADPDRFDVVVTDQAMPGMLGSDLIVHLRAVNADLPCVLATGHHGLSDGELSRIKVDALLTKPYDMNSLARVLNRMLGLL